jgi:dTDP-L-rhamnose 4-epimerase
MRVLVTGGAGFIGSHLADRFLREGFKVRILDNLDAKVHPHGKPPYLPSDVEFVRADIRDRDALSRALDDVQVISHQAAYQDYMPDFSKFVDVNATGTALLYELIVEKRLKIWKVIVASSQAVYGEGQYECAEHGEFLPPPRSAVQLSHAEWEIVCPRCDQPAKSHLLREEFTNPYNQYSVSKLAEEKIAIGLGWLHGIPTVAMRYSITQGPRQSLFNHYSGVCRIFVSRALRGEPLVVYEDGKQTRDFVHIQDVVDANMLVLKDERANFHAFNVGSGRAVSVLEYADAVRSVIGGDISMHLSREYRRGDNRNSVSSVQKLANLGWSPQHGLPVILLDFVKWVREVGGIPVQVSDAYRVMKGAGVVLAAAD